MRKSIAFLPKHLDHKVIAMRLFLKCNVQERGFAQVRRELMQMELNIEDTNKIIDLVKKLVQ
jgi:hypothetical protein